ncbi:MAG: LLM class F420-dependent oxidoreductase [Candidatus Velamenicoccus archaeovorus]
MRLGLHLGHWERRPWDAVELVREAERLGFDSVWTSEAWGSDAVTTLAWVAAHTTTIGLGTAVMQIPARSPAMTAMTAITLDHLTGGRFRLGLGVSGPQVAEGWHGMPFDDPLGRTREYVDIVRTVLRRERPLEHHGRHYDLPLRGGTGLGRALKVGVVPLRREVPLYLAALGPRNVALAAEIADGWLPILSSPERSDLFRGALEEGFDRRGGRPEGFDVAPLVPLEVGEDMAACRDRVRPFVARYVGGMGAPGANFYHALVRRYGFGRAAEQIQDRYLSGRRGEAAAAVPDELIDQLALIGPRERIRERLNAWREAGTTTLLVRTSEPAALRVLCEAAGREVSR